MAGLISIIIPSKNEPLLQELVNDVNRTLDGVPHEIIVVDKSIARPTITDAQLIRQRSDGLGKGILEAIPHASGQLILTMDGDYSHNPSELMRLLKASQDYDIVLGSRYVPGGRNLDSSLRNQVSRGYSWMARMILRLPLADPMSGLCVTRRSIFETLTLNPIGYKINLELIYKARRNGLSVVELPITFHARRAGRSKAGIMEGIRTLVFVIALRLGLR